MRTTATMLALLLLAACNDSTGAEDDGPAPALPPASPATVLVEESFDQENGGTGALNWPGNSRWKVVSGCVDLHGNGFHDVQPGRGLYLDLDGTCQRAGTVESATQYSLEAGTYILEFGLGGNRRIDEPDTVVVSVGTHFSEQLVVPRTAALTQYTREFNVSAAAMAAVRFAHAGGDNQGIVLDLIRLRRK
jgi:hypothetical protein